MVESAKQHLESWGQAVIDTNYDAICAHYKEEQEAVLVPTLSAEKRQSNARRLDYFHGFAPKVSSVTWHWDNAVFQTLGNIVIVSGEYDFALTDGVSSARFTYVIDVSADPKIVTHHSSLLPN